MIYCVDINRKTHFHSIIPNTLWITTMIPCTPGNEAENTCYIAYTFNILHYWEWSLSIHFLYDDITQNEIYGKCVSLQNFHFQTRILSENITVLSLWFILFKLHCSKTWWLACQHQNPQNTNFLQFWEHRVKIRHQYQYNRLLCTSLDIFSFAVLGTCSVFYRKVNYTLRDLESPTKSSMSQASVRPCLLM
jgi:hypothetical protein